MSINPGDLVRVSTDPPFTNAAGVATDPTTVTLEWRRAGGATTTWVYGTDVEVVRDAAGTFHADIPIAERGLHYYRWVGTGAVQAAEEGTFLVTTSWEVT